MSNSATRRLRPRSPNIQIYRPQLTSVLSITNRITGVVLSIYAVLLVGWLIAAAAGPHAFLLAHTFIHSWIGQILLLACTFSFFVHLCGGLRHLAWDAGYGFELRQIYASGWAIVIASVALTAAAWIIAFVLSE
jgi:succinate dehydrogenase / fumarate reductase cytochrome b subunit